MMDNDSTPTKHSQEILRNLRRWGITIETIVGTKTQPLLQLLIEWGRSLTLAWCSVWSMSFLKAGGPDIDCRVLLRIVQWFLSHLASFAHPATRSCQYSQSASSHQLSQVFESDFPDLFLTPGCCIPSAASLVLQSADVLVMVVFFWWLPGSQWPKWSYLMKFDDMLSVSIHEISRICWNEGIHGSVFPTHAAVDPFCVGIVLRWL